MNLPELRQEMVAAAKKGNKKETEKFKKAIDDFTKRQKKNMTNFMSQRIQNQSSNLNKSFRTVSNDSGMSVLSKPGEMRVDEEFKDFNKKFKYINNSSRNHATAIMSKFKTNLLTNVVKAKIKTSYHQINKNRSDPNLHKGHLNLNI